MPGAVTAVAAREALTHRVGIEVWVNGGPLEGRIEVEEVVFERDAGLDERRDVRPERSLPPLEPPVDRPGECADRECASGG